MTETTAQQALRYLLSRHQRVGITGPPKSGKTTLSQRLKGIIHVVHCDDYINEGWSQCSQTIADIGNAWGGRLIVEGVQVPRAIRKGLRLDALLVLTEPLQELTPGQNSLAKGVVTVIQDCQDKGYLHGLEAVYCGGEQ